MNINESKKLYELKLHETYTTFFGICVMRIPGGWLYDCWDFNSDNYKQGTFIPFDNEFQLTKSCYNSKN